MYRVIKHIIDSGDYKLSDVQHRITKLYVMGNLTEEQMEELLLLSQRKASIDSERPEILTLLEAIDARLRIIENILFTNNPEDDGDEPTEPGEEEPKAYEPWAPWDGLSNKYQPGAIVSHNGKLWQSIHSGQNTWEPGIIGTEALWVEYVEEPDVDPDKEPTEE